MYGCVSAVWEISWLAAFYCLWQITYTAELLVCSHAWLSALAPYFLPSKVLPNYFFICFLGNAEQSKFDID